MHSLSFPACCRLTPTQHIYRLLGTRTRPFGDAVDGREALRRASLRLQSGRIDISSKAATPSSSAGRVVLLQGFVDASARFCVVFTCGFLPRDLDATVPDRMIFGDILSSISWDLIPRE